MLGQERRGNRKDQRKGREEMGGQWGTWPCRKGAVRTRGGRGQRPAQTPGIAGPRKVPGGQAERGGRRFTGGNGYNGVGGGEEGKRVDWGRGRGLLKISQCITQNVRVYSFILGIAGTENPAQKCHRLSCLITCCLLTPSLQGACLNLPLGPQGTRKQKTSPSPSLGSWPCLRVSREELHLPSI